MSDINAIGSIYEASRYYDKTNVKQPRTDNRNTSFEALFQSASKLINETNALTNAAEEQEINYALGITDNVHDLQIAQQKANISIQYTVAVKNGVTDAYREIMNLQF